MQFEKFIGVDYSGAKSAHAPLTGIRVFDAPRLQPPLEVRCTSGRHWSRAALAEWLHAQLQTAQPTLIGLDHGFSFPKIFFLRHALRDWDAFLDFFVHKMPTHQLSIEELRRAHRLLLEPSSPLRLCENWTSSAKSVFQFDMQGSVAKSTYTGLPWLRHLRHALGEQLFFWPFDGFLPPAGVSVICEVYPALYKRRYRRGELGLDAFDAYAVVRWMQDMQQRATLAEYFNPPLNEEEQAIARLEGWILGVR